MNPTFSKLETLNKAQISTNDINNTENKDAERKIASSSIVTHMHFDF